MARLHVVANIRPGVAVTVAAAAASSAAVEVLYDGVSQGTTNIGASSSETFGPYVQEDMTLRVTEVGEVTYSDAAQVAMAHNAAGLPIASDSGLPAGVADVQKLGTFAAGITSRRSNSAIFIGDSLLASHFTPNAASAITMNDGIVSGSVHQKAFFGMPRLCNSITSEEAASGPVSR